MKLSTKQRRSARRQVCSSGFSRFEVPTRGGLGTRSRLKAELRTASAFTLMEVLAALLFMAIVIPVGVEGLRTASLAGEVGMRKKAAARIGQSALDEMRANTQAQSAVSSGQVQEGSQTYQWSIRTETWPADVTGVMRMATVDVGFAVQGKNYDVKLSTLLAQQ